jgi:hypothetical protein
MACVAAASRFESYSAASAFGCVFKVLSLSSGGTPAVGQCYCWPSAGVLLTSVSSRHCGLIFRYCMAQEHHKPLADIPM